MLVRVRVNRIHPKERPETEPRSKTNTCLLFKMRFLFTCPEKLFDSHICPIFALYATLYIPCVYSNEIYRSIIITIIIIVIIIIYHF